MTTDVIDDPTDTDEPTEADKKGKGKEDKPHKGKKSKKTKADEKAKEAKAAEKAERKASRRKRLKPSADMALALTVLFASLAGFLAYAGPLWDHPRLAYGLDHAVMYGLIVLGVVAFGRITVELAKLAINGDDDTTDGDDDA